jgi:glycerol-3-phosphate acyltransferase PlsX
VVVTDGFTGNVALKTLEGSLRFFMDTLLEVLTTNEDTKKASEALLPYLAPLAAEFDPDNTGGAALLGVDGVCVISHGSSSAQAMVSAVKVAYEVATAGLVDRLAQAVTPA